MQTELVLNERDKAWHRLMFRHWAAGEYVEDILVKSDKHMSWNLLVKDAGKAPDEIKDHVYARLLSLLVPTRGDEDIN
jgi:hypothetical protein